MELKNTKLSPPWITFVNEVKALFENDLDVRVMYDDNENDLKIFVDNMDKADALAKLMPTEKTFGNVTLKIGVYPANRENETMADLFYRAFVGNNAVAYTHHADTIFGPMDYIVCKRDIAQFFNDQMDDINGVKSMLYADLAKDVFETKAGVYFCTDVKPMSDLAKPLGEWP